MSLDPSTVASDPSPYLRGLPQLAPEQRLAAILSGCGRAPRRRRRLPAEAVVWLVSAMAPLAADSIPEVWRRLTAVRVFGFRKPWVSWMIR